MIPTPGHLLLDLFQNFIAGGIPESQKLIIGYSIDEKGTSFVTIVSNDR